MTETLRRRRQVTNQSKLITHMMKESAGKHHRKYFVRMHILEHKSPQVFVVKKVRATLRASHPEKSHGSIPYVTDFIVYCSYYCFIKQLITLREFINVLSSLGVRLARHCFISLKKQLEFDTKKTRVCWSCCRVRVK